MKKAGKAIVKQMPPVKIYLDDLQELYNILKNTCEKVTINTDIGVISDFEQLKYLNNKKIHNLSLDCCNPYISLDLKKDGARLYIAEGLKFNKGILAEIERTLGRCYRNLARVFANYALLIISCIVLITMSFLALKFTEGAIRVGLISLFTVLYACLCVFNYKIEKVYSTIILSDRQ